MVSLFHRATIKNLYKVLNLNKDRQTKPKLKPTIVFKNCSCVWVSLCTTVIHAHNTAQNSSDNFPSHPPNNHQCSDVYTGGEGD